MIYLVASLATDAERATLAERAMRASRKNGDISATGDRGEVAACLGPFYTIRQFGSLLGCITAFGGP